MALDDKQGSTQYEVYRGGELLFDYVTNYGMMHVNRSGTDFVLPITLGGYEVWVLQKDHFELWFAGEPRPLPVFAGDNLVAVGPAEYFEENGESVAGVSILVNGVEVAKVMMAMPIVFTFMFLWFPSGLVLYWTINNILSIAQQWQITRLIESGKRTTG